VGVRSFLHRFSHADGSSDRLKAWEGVRERNSALHFTTGFPSKVLSLTFAGLASLAVPEASRAPTDSLQNANPEAPRHGSSHVKNLRVREDGSVTNSNWSGYVVTAAAGQVTDIKGTWIVPTVSCGIIDTSSSSWVGIDGYQKTNLTLEQIGTESKCIGGIPLYYAWHEFLPNEPTAVLIQSVPVNPGDVISAEVAFSGGQFTATITDETTLQSFQIGETVPNAQLSSAEWITEAPTDFNTNTILPLADFGTEFYGSVFTGVAGTCVATVGGQTGPIGAFQTATAITLIDEKTQDPEALPSQLSADGSSFWVDFVGFTTLHEFGGSDGAGPSGPLLEGTDGNLYGTTDSGGVNDSGTVFQMNPVNPGNSVTTLYKFCFQFAPCHDGQEPTAALVQGSNGNFYGTTGLGGATAGMNGCSQFLGCGTVFEITPGGDLTTLHSFVISDGAFPAGGLLQATDGNFYGTTLQDGSGGFGTVFQITPGGALNTVHSFGGSDGSAPRGRLVQAADGNFYGTTTNGGTGTACGAIGCGTVFQITPGGVLTMLHSFNGTDGSGPSAGLVQASDGNLYGTTAVGGTSSACGAAGCGTVFRITLGGAFAQLLNFNGTNGNQPQAELVQPADGDLYGTTAFGGTTFGGTSSVCGNAGCGTVLVLAALMAVLVFTLRGRREAGATKPRLTLVPFAAGLLLLATLAGCGGEGQSSSNLNPGTPAGTYNLTVTGIVGSGATAVSHSVTLTLKVS
jgi:uncharacterized repeat protein (TIGR03803 family)